MTERKFLQTVANKKHRTPIDRGPISFEISDIIDSITTLSESPIEVRISRFLTAHLRDEISIQQQKRVIGVGRNFRPDFVLSGAGLSVVIEADGKDFHTDKEKDERRDYEILVRNDIDEIWRIPGGAIVRSEAAAMCRFVATHLEWFADSVDSAIDLAGVRASRDFTPVLHDGWYAIPQTPGARTQFRGVKRSMLRRATNG